MCPVSIIFLSILGANMTLKILQKSRIWGPSWPKLAQVGPIMGLFGTKLAQVGATWGHLERSWDSSWTKLGQVGSKMSNMTLNDPKDTQKHLDHKPVKYRTWSALFCFARVQILCVVWLLAAGVWLLTSKQANRKAEWNLNHVSYTGSRTGNKHWQAKIQ